MSIIHPYREFPDLSTPAVLLTWWRDNYQVFLRALTYDRYRRFYGQGSISNNLLIYPPECNRMENKLNGRKPQRHERGLGSSNAQPSSIRWINIALTSEDLSILEREEASLEQLAFSFVQLGMFGLGLSIKYDRTRKSYSVSIYRPSDATNVQSLGISGASPDLRDALLVSLYRFNHCLGGSFDNAPDTDATVQPRRFY